MLAAASVFAWTHYASLCGTPCVDLAALDDFRPDEGSTLYDRDGAEIGMLYRKNRRVLALDALPPHVASAFVAIEDHRFRDHTGVDLPRVAGAVLANVRALGVAEGFSTITMQLARNVFPEALPPRERTLRRKLTEVRVARDIEARFTKDEILMFYLNTIYLGSGAYGVEAAARTYFGKSAESLTVAEAALLAGLPKAPSRYSPYRDPDAALARRALVLRAMEAIGHLTAEVADRAAGEPLILAHHDTDAAVRSATSIAPYFVEEIRKNLEERFGEILYSGGLEVHTTLDTALQAATEREIEAQVRRIESHTFGRFSGLVRDTLAPLAGGRTAYLQAAALFMDPRSGDVLAMVGGRDHDDSEFNRTTQAMRQPGSAFKPIVYTAAWLAGISPRDSVADGPIRIPLETGEVWEPRNFHADTAGEPAMITVTDALVRSRNRAAVRLAQLAGLDSVASVARQMGITRPIPPYPSIALGAIEIPMVELLTAYGALARADGLRARPRMVTRVLDRSGRVLLATPPHEDPSVDPAAAALTRSVLEAAVDRGTGTAVRSAGVLGPVAGKTGTTNESTDTWFIGFTPERMGAVWLGFDEPRRILPGRAATGGSLAAPVWGRIVAAHPGSDSIDGDPWGASPETLETLVTGRLRAGCPSLRPIGSATGPAHEGTAEPTDTPAMSRDSLPGTPPPSDPTPSDFFGRVLDRLRGTVEGLAGVRPAPAPHYICVAAPAPAVPADVAPTEPSGPSLLDRLRGGDPGHDLP